MKSDRMLFWIVVVIAVLAIAAIAVFFLREEPQYMNENTPEAVVHDFVLALYDEDYEKAFGYIYSDIDYEDFLEIIAMDRDYYLRYGVIIDSSNILDQNNATVNFFLSYETRNLLRSANPYPETAILKIDEVDGRWKIIRMDTYMFFLNYPEEKVIPNVVP